MNKNIILIIIPIALILISGFIYFGYSANFLNKISSPKTEPEGIILFYGDGCPHCKIVDDFISENKIEEKVKFTRLEVWYDKKNADILIQKAKICNIVDKSSIGVPFLWDGANCVVGDQDVIKFFEEKAK